METLTKEQRHEVYKLALENLKKSFVSGRQGWMCPCIHDAFIELEHFFLEYSSLTEFISKKPSHANIISWFPITLFTQAERHQKRIEILTQCIEETK